MKAATATSRSSKTPAPRISEQVARQIVAEFQQRCGFVLERAGLVLVPRVEWDAYRRRSEAELDGRMRFYAKFPNRAKADGISMRIVRAYLRTKDRQNKNPRRKGTLK